MLCTRVVVMSVRGFLSRVPLDLPFVNKPCGVREDVLLCRWAAGHA